MQLTTPEKDHGGKDSNYSDGNQVEIQTEKRKEI